MKKILLAFVLYILYTVVSYPEMFPSSAISIFKNTGVDYWPHERLMHLSGYDFLHYGDSYELFIAKGTTEAAPAGVNWHHEPCTDDDLFSFWLRNLDDYKAYHALRPSLPDQYDAWCRYDVSDDEIWQLMYDTEENILFVYRLYEMF